MVAADHTGLFNDAKVLTFVATAWTATVQTAAFVKTSEAANVIVFPPLEVYVIRVEHGPAGVTVIL